MPEHPLRSRGDPAGPLLSFAPRPEQLDNPPGGGVGHKPGDQLRVAERSRGREDGEVRLPVDPGSHDVSPTVEERAAPAELATTLDADPADGGETGRRHRGGHGTGAANGRHGLGRRTYPAATRDATRKSVR